MSGLKPKANPKGIPAWLSGEGPIGLVISSALSERGVEVRIWPVVFADNAGNDQLGTVLISPCYSSWKRKAS